MGLKLCILMVSLLECIQLKKKNYFTIETLQGARDCSPMVLFKNLKSVKNHFTGHQCHTILNRI